MNSTNQPLSSFHHRICWSDLYLTWTPSLRELMKALWNSIEGLNTEDTWKASCPSYELTLQFLQGLVISYRKIYIILLIYLYIYSVAISLMEVNIIYDSLLFFIYSVYLIKFKYDIDIFEIIIVCFFF